MSSEYVVHQNPDGKTCIKNKRMEDWDYLVAWYNSSLIWFEVEVQPFAYRGTVILCVS